MLPLPHKKDKEWYARLAERESETPRTVANATLAPNRMANKNDPIVEQSSCWVGFQMVQDRDNIGSHWSDRVVFCRGIFHRVR